MKALLFGSKIYTRLKRELGDTSDQHGESAETWTEAGPTRVKIYPSNCTQEQAPEGVNINDLFTGITDDQRLNLRDYIVDGTNAYLIIGIRKYAGSIQLDLWKDGGYYE